MDHPENAQAYKNERLLAAVWCRGWCKRTDSLQEIQTLIDDGADVDATDSRGWTSLHRAVHHRDPEIVQLLLFAGATPDLVNDEGDSPVHLALNFGSFELVRLLVYAFVDEDGTSLLLRAVQLERVDLVELFTHAGANVNYIDDEGDSILVHALIRGKTDVIRQLIEAGADVKFVHERKEQQPYKSILHLAIDLGDVDTLKLILDCGADVNQDGHHGMSALYRAIVYNNRRPISKLLLSRGASMYESGRDGLYSPLKWLISRNRVEDVELLLNNGFDLDRCKPRASDDFSLVHEAVTFQETSMLKLLLDHDFKGSLDLEHEDEHGHTALHLALEKKYQSHVRLLLKAGADANHADADNRSPLEMVISSGSRESMAERVQLLIDAGAEIRNVDICDLIFQKVRETPADEMVLELAKYLIKRRILYESLHTNVDRPLAESITDQSPELRDHYEACEVEIAKLRSSPLYNSATYFCFFENGAYKLMKNQHVIELAVEEDDLHERFPLYAEDLRFCLWRAKKEYDFMSEAARRLSLLLNVDFHHLIVQRILHFLSRRDIRNLNEI